MVGLLLQIVDKLDDFGVPYFEKPPFFRWGLLRKHTYVTKNYVDETPVDIDLSINSGTWMASGCLPTKVVGW